MNLLTFLFWTLFILFITFILLSFLFRSINFTQKVDSDVIRTFAFIFSVFLVTIFGILVKDQITYTFGSQCTPIFGVPNNSEAPLIGAAICDAVLSGTLIILFAISYILLHTFLLTLIR